MEWTRIRAFTDGAKWTSGQRTMMSRANRVHGGRLAAAMTAAVLLVCTGLWIRSRVEESQMRITASERVAALLSAETVDVPKLVNGLPPYRRWANAELADALTSSDAKQLLRAGIALLPVDTSHIQSLKNSLLDATPAHPMVAPSWCDSVKYYRWLTEKMRLVESDQAYADPMSLDKPQFPPDGDTGFPKNWPLNLDARGFRLPTASELEIAARAGMRTIYGFGNDESWLERYAWLQTNSERQAHIAKELRPNLRGLFDMHGNTYEWCHDWYASYPLGDVIGDPVGSAMGSNRMCRGGG